MQSTSLSNLWVGTGLSVGNPWIQVSIGSKHAQIQVSHSREASTCHRYLPYLPISVLFQPISDREAGSLWYWTSAYHSMPLPVPAVYGYTWLKL